MTDSRERELRGRRRTYRQRVCLGGEPTHRFETVESFTADERIVDEEDIINAAKGGQQA